MTTNRRNPQESVALTINGKAVRVAKGTTLWEAARELGVEIPVLCHSPRLAPVGVCRLCVVDLGERVLAASCVRECEEGMRVETHSAEVEQHRKTLLQLLLADYPASQDAAAGDDAAGDLDQLLELRRRYGVTEIPFSDGAAAPEAARGRDDSSPVIAVNHQACILCDRCIRACDDLQHNDVIGRTGKGYTARIAFDLNAPMGQSTCVSCGECMAVCPTDALTNKNTAGLRLVRD